jgi:hypothetical protein
MKPGPSGMFSASGARATLCSTEEALRLEPRLSWLSMAGAGALGSWNARPHGRPCGPRNLSGMPAGTWREPGTARRTQDAPKALEP